MVDGEESMMKHGSISGTERLAWRDSAAKAEVGIIRAKICW